jgi:hypothetical protein
MAKILILYSSVDGHTQTICRRIAERAEAAWARGDPGLDGRRPAMDPANSTGS